MHLYESTNNCTKYCHQKLLELKTSCGYCVLVQWVNLESKSRSAFFSGGPPFCIGLRLFTVARVLDSTGSYFCLYFQIYISFLWNHASDRAAGQIHGHGVSHFYCLLSTTVLLTGSTRHKMPRACWVHLSLLPRILLLCSNAYCSDLLANCILLIY